MKIRNNPSANKKFEHAKILLKARDKRDKEHEQGNHNTPKLDRIIKDQELWFHNHNLSHSKKHLKSYIAAVSEATVSPSSTHHETFNPPAPKVRNPPQRQVHNRARRTSAAPFVAR